jgi:hydrogenase maturation protease
MGDDGLGLIALEILRERARFDPAPELVDGGTWGMNLLPIIEGADRLLMIDAIRAGGAPGELIVLEREALPRGLGVKLSPHQIDLQEVLALAELRDRLPAQAVAIGLEPARVELGCGLSPELSGAVDGLLERIVDQLGAWGHSGGLERAA